MHWKIIENPFISTQSTESKVRDFYIATKTVQSILQIIEFLKIYFLEQIRSLEGIQHTIVVIQDNHFTSRSKHISVPISYIHEQINPKKI